MKNVVVMLLRVPVQWEEYRLWDFLGVLEWRMVPDMEVDGEWWYRPVENSIVSKEETLRQYWEEIERVLALAKINGVVEADLCWIDGGHWLDRLQVRLDPGRLNRLGGPFQRILMDLSDLFSGILGEPRGISSFVTIRTFRAWSS